MAVIFITLIFVIFAACHAQQNPLSVSVNLPYSLKLGETLYIPVEVFNNQQQNINLNLQAPASGHTSLQSLFLPAHDKKPVYYPITPSKTGEITIKVKASSSGSENIVRHKLIVETEGVKREKNTALIMDLGTSFRAITNSMTLDIPATAVPNSGEAELQILGNLMGSTIGNVHELIKVPSGCGEQNMISLVPDIVITDYLNTTGELTIEIEETAKKYMETGYKTQQKYRHKDGSFSVFGESDKNGSTWLTAFVARYFNQAKQFIEVEEEVISQAYDWLSQQQARNGCFPEVGQISHKDMQGGSGQGIALTAFTLLAFLERNETRRIKRCDCPSEDHYQETIDKALGYIEQNFRELEDVYALAIVTYALHLAKHPARNAVLDLLEMKAKTKDDLKWWEKSKAKKDYVPPESISVEITSYALLSYLEVGRVNEALPMAKWLISKRNNKGGFLSTQDTILGITALAKFCEKSSMGGQNDMKIFVVSDRGSQATFNVTRENSLDTQKVQLSPDTKTVFLTAIGKGSATVQVSYSYNDKGEIPGQCFKLDTEVTRHQDYFNVTVCSSFKPDEDSKHSNMAIVEVNMPSGYTVKPDALALIRASEKVRLVETKNKDSKVAIYFDSLDENQRCPVITATKNFEVTGQKPAVVSVYDYYDTSCAATSFYNID